MYTYSPLPIESYFLPGLNGMCEAGTIATLERSQSIWNLFWLSNPALDALPNCKGRWSDHYKPKMGDGAAVVCDVMLDEVLHRKLLMHPTRFAAWFEREDQDHSIYDTYDAMGEDAWSSTVIARAQMSAVRMASTFSALSKEGNVYQFLRTKAA